MPFITAEEACKEFEPNQPLAECLSQAAAQGARSVEIEKLCTSAFPTDVKLNNECREFCWARTDDAASCTLEATEFINSEREFQHAQRHHQMVLGALLIGLVAVIVILMVRRTRSAIGRFLARCIYSVSGFDIRRISERWRRYP
jgi:hypothetical protein